MTDEKLEAVMAKYFDGTIGSFKSALKSCNVACKQNHIYLLTEYRFTEYVLNHKLDEIESAISAMAGEEIKVSVERVKD